MPTTEPNDLARIRSILASYDESLVRRVAGRLIAPRGFWPVDELIQRILEALQNPVLLDRKLRALLPACRKALALMAFGQQPSWTVRALIEGLAALGETEIVEALQTLVEEGFVYPDVPPQAALSDPAAWLARAISTDDRLLTSQGILSRIRNEELGLSELPEAGLALGGHLEADGLELPLRLAALWQEVAYSPMRLTIQGELFKRDLTRLQSDPLMRLELPDSQVELPDPIVLLVELGIGCGVLVRKDNELQAGEFPTSWERSLTTCISHLWSAVAQLSNWNVYGAVPNDQPRRLLALNLLTFLTLIKQPAGRWVSISAIQDDLMKRHPHWQRASGGANEIWAKRLLLGLGYVLRLVQLAKIDGEWAVRATDLARHLLAGAKEPVVAAEFPQTLLVQPNCEILVYRQGLTPKLLVTLAKFAKFRAIGPACSMELTAESVYRGLETGLTHDFIVRTLQQRSSRPVPDPVLSVLRTWADKRERVTVYNSATLIEFQSAEELKEAHSRGLIRLALTERIGLAADDFDSRGLRIIANRDYESAQQKCVSVSEDGVTLIVDIATSDLLLETELTRLAESVGMSSGRRIYRITQASLRLAQTTGLSSGFLDQWFIERTAGSTPPAVRMLWASLERPSVFLGSCVILDLPSETFADGLAQWPGTRDLLGRRLGPKTWLVEAERLSELRAALTELGLQLPQGNS